MRLVLDTNVLIAAALKSGLARDILEFAPAHEIIILTSEEILSELRRKLLSKFDKSETNVDFFISKVRNISEVIETKEKVTAIKRDQDDNKILECAVAGKAHLIISADQDLINLKKFRGIGIIHPKTLAWTLPDILTKNKSN